MCSNRIAIIPKKSEYVPTERENKAKTEDTSMAKKNTIWVVRVNRGLDGWQDLKTFTSAAAADDWLCEFVRSHGYWMNDFNLVRREV